MAEDQSLLNGYCFPFMRIFKKIDWFICPPKEALFFTFRTIIASYLALTIALWMEMDSPKWAFMSTWIVAQTTRGESIARSRWRVIGTILGVVIAVFIVISFPQQPFLFEFSVAIWLALCCWIGSLIRSSASYGAVLAGYTCALIAFAASEEPENVFMLAMSRGTYIILGVACENLVARAFSHNLDRQARDVMEDNLLTTIRSGLKTVIDILDGDHEAGFRSHAIFSKISQFRTSFEFRKFEMHGNDHSVDHAHASLFSVSAVLTRAASLSVYMMELKEKSDSFEIIIAYVRAALQDLLDNLQKGTDFGRSLRGLEQLRWECRQRITDYFISDVNKSLQILDNEASSDLLGERILYRALSELLGEISVTLAEYKKSIQPIPGDHFRFPMHQWYNIKVANGNALRVFTAVMLACLIWEVTAWDKMVSALTLLVIACGRLCLFENAYRMSIGFLRGTLYAIAIGGLVNFTMMGQSNTIEMVYLAFFLPLFVGGLSIYNPSTRGTSMGYTIFLPFMLLVSNQGRMDELTFFNNAIAMAFAGFMSAIAFRFISPYDPKKHRQEIRRKMLLSLRALPTLQPIPRTRRWVANATDQFVNIMRQFNIKQEAELSEAYNRGALALMAIGVNIIRLRFLIKNDVLPEDIKQQLRVVLRRIAQFRGGRYRRTVTIAHSAIRKLRSREANEKNVARRLEISNAITSLILISYALDKNAVFLDSADDQAIES